MVVLRPDIEKALDDLISNEEGMRFQGLAVVLAKQRWPDFIACERKKDLGADAIGSGRVLACSLTATLGKIKKDATKVKKHFDVKTLVFATPQGVTNTTAEKWAVEIRKEFGYELVVMPREDIITSLMNPVNVALCRTHLGIPVTLGQPVEELVQRVRDAASEAVAAWSVRLAGKPFIDLRAVTISPDGKDAADVFLLADFQRAMTQSRRVVIEAPAGRGKTTTLVQLAAQYDGSGNLAFLIDLPAWVKSGTGILQYIAGIPAFQSRSINAEALARLQKVEHFSFLLNGWNEVGESDSVRAVQALRELERDFPAAGILVATRTHHIVPPLPGALRARLLPVNRAQRKRYLDQRLGGRADELRAKLDGDPVLDELTETPLILSEVVVIFEAGAPIPQSKIGVLESVMRLLEQSDEHSGHLQVEPLSGRAHEYLGALAAAMTDQGAVTLPEDNARVVAHSVAVRLRDAGQIAALSEPQAVLNVLCAHHVLERLTYPVTSFRFAHQQFQEFYAALLLKRQLLALVGQPDSQKICEYTKRYVNEPAWSEPLRMIANEIGVATTASAADITLVRAGVLLIEMALKADPVYAAELAYLSGASVWKEIESALAQRLRALYSVPDEHFRQRALAGMLASGSEDFKDIVLPLLTSEDQQVRLGAFRTWPDFHVSCIGPDWRKTVMGWKEDVRAEFVSELLHFGNARETIASFALADASVKVRIAAISALVWGGSREDVTKLLGSLDDETFKAALHDLPLETIPGPIHPRALAAYQESYREATDPVARVRALLLIAEVGGGNIVSKLKDELDKCPRGTLEQLARYVTRPALDLIRQTGQEWVSHWVAERIVDGNLRGETWIALVSSVPEELKERLLRSIENEDFKHARYSGLISVLASVSDASMVERIFARLCALRGIIAGAPDVKHDLEWAVERQLEELFRSVPANIAVAGLSARLSGNVERLELTVVTRLYGRVGRSESDLRDTLQSDLRQLLRGYLRKGVSIMLREDDFNGEQKANLASALAQVGDPEDMPVLRELIQADIARIVRGQEARARGDRGKQGNGAAMRYGNWHVRALLQLAPDAADTLLLEILKEPEYERDAAWALVQLASTSKVEAGFGFGFGFGKRTDYGKIWEARQGQLQWSFHEERRKRYAAAIRERVESILQESKDAGQPRPYDFRLKELTKALAVVDSSGSTDLILKLLSSQDTWNGWPVVQALDTLLFNGIVLPTNETLKIFDTLLGHVRSLLWDNQQVGLLIHALCLLPFIENAGTGVAKIREVVTELKLRSYQLRDVTAALGHSRCPEAVGLLCEFASDDALIKQLGEAWINAVATLDYPESRQLLLSLVDPEISGLPAGLTFDREDVLAARLAELTQRETAIRQRLFQLCSLQLPSPKRMLLAKVVGMLGTTEAILAGLNLIDDTSAPPVPYDIWKQLELTFVEHKSVNPESNAYTPAPRSSNPIRSRLFEMATTDARRGKAASSLLGQIEVWRLEYGRPSGEPRNPDVECKGS
jgi:HEAT repeat protein